jgi:hypothetical protein
MKQIILLLILKCPEFEKTKMIQKKIGGGVLFKSDIEYFIDFTRKRDTLNKYLQLFLLVLFLKSLLHNTFHKN